MAGTPAGGRKTSEILKEKYGEDFYARIGRKGGGGGAFVKDRQFASDMGKIGGQRSSRKHNNLGKHLRKRNP